MLIYDQNQKVVLDGMVFNEVKWNINIQMFFFRNFIVIFGGGQGGCSDEACLKIVNL